MLEIKIEKIKIPNCFKVIKNDFYTYDPNKNFEENLRLEYLKEDLLQLENKTENIIIDLGWYSNSEDGDGIFKLFEIRNNDWENPEKIETSKSQEMIKRKLQELLNMYL